MLITSGHERLHVTNQKLNPDFTGGIPGACATGLHPRYSHFEFLRKSSFWKSQNLTFVLLVWGNVHAVGMVVLSCLPSRKKLNSRESACSLLDLGNWFNWSWLKALAAMNSVIKDALPECGLIRAKSGVYGSPCFCSSFKYNFSLEANCTLSSQDLPLVKVVSSSRLDAKCTWSSQDPPLVKVVTSRCQMHLVVSRSTSS